MKVEERKIPTSITLTIEQLRWIEENKINLSQYVRKKIEEDMKK